MTEEIDKSKWPAFYYHRKLAREGRIFNSPAELKAAGPGWVDTPAAFGVVTHPPEEPPEWMKPVTKERLSMLQKWILQEAYKGGESAGESDYRLSKKTIYEKFFGIKCEYVDSGRLRFQFAEDPGNKPVILSRSTAKLNEMGYITISRHHLTLTEKGIGKAEMLLKV